MLTVLGIILILIGSLYYIVYLKKKKNNTQNDIGYKITFFIVFLLVTVELV
ncbi:UNVERIFIED_ORG: hypothetical protein ABIC97_005530 [Peribacillus simplex]